MTALKELGDDTNMITFEESGKNEFIVHTDETRRMAEYLCDGER
jgi:hypothetical protein